MLGVLALIASVGLGSCIPEGELPEIVSLNVSPSTISMSERASTDWTVTMTVAGFEGAIVDADAFIQLNGDQEEAPKDTFGVEGDTIELVDIERSWFNAISEPGEYRIGASVLTDAGEDITQLDLATVVVTP